jgi:hypothetical protein
VANIYSMRDHVFFNWNFAPCFLPHNLYQIESKQSSSLFITLHAHSHTCQVKFGSEFTTNYNIIIPNKSRCILWKFCKKTSIFPSKYFVLFEFAREIHPFLFIFISLCKKKTRLCAYCCFFLIKPAIHNQVYVMIRKIEK